MKCGGKSVSVEMMLTDIKNSPASQRSVAANLSDQIRNERKWERIDPHVSVADVHRRDRNRR